MIIRKIKSNQRRFAYLAAVGQFSLVIAILLERFVARWLPAVFPIDFLSGFFMGLSLVFNLALLVTYSRSIHTQNGD